MIVRPAVPASTMTGTPERTPMRSAAGRSRRGPTSNACGFDESRGHETAGGVVHARLRIHRAGVGADRGDAIALDDDVDGRIESRCRID